MQRQQHAAGASLLLQATLTDYTGPRDESGLCHGRGRACFTSGQTYDGTWEHGQMHGEGSMQFPDGVQYNGSFQAGSISGAGVYSWDGASYEGEVLQGLRHGHGRLSLADSPAVYEGQWQHGMRHGRGALYYNADRTAFYNGDWQADLKHGQGTSVFPNGNSYTGAWVQDQRQGHGTMQWLTRGQRYTGQWHQGQPEGFGEHLWLQQQRAATGQHGCNHAMHVMHNRYLGMFQAGQRHGQGTLYYSSGACYEGQWQHGKKHGLGVYVFEDGCVFSGQFVDDRPVLASGAMLGAASTLCDASSSSSSSSSRMSQAGRTADGQRTGTAGAVGSANDTPAARPGTEQPSSKPAVKPSRPGPTKAGSKAPSSSSASAAAATATTAAAGPASKRASTAGSAVRPGSWPEAVAGSTGSSGSSGSSAAGAPGFGPASSVMQLYIADLLQQYDEQQPAAAYRAVSNLLVGYNTELRLLYDRYSVCPSPLLDSSVLGHSSALQACQLWEMLRDARLLCRHLNLQQVSSLVQMATAPPPALLQYRQQQAQAAASESDAQQQQQQQQRQMHTGPGTQLLFREFCELLVRLAAARYPLLPALDMQLQQVVSHHLLPLLHNNSTSGLPARQPASTGRASMLLTASAAAASCGASADAAGPSSSTATPAGPEQQLRSPELVHYLHSHAERLHQLFAAFAADASRSSQPQAADKAAGAGAGAEQQQQQQQQPEHECSAAGATPPPACSHGLQAGACQPQAASVQQVLACLQGAGVLLSCQVEPEAVAACLLHSTRAVTDPQGLRACIEEPDAVSEASFQRDSSRGPRAATAPAASEADAALQAEREQLLFWMDAPLLLQDVMWGLVRLAAVLPQAACTPATQQPAAGVAGQHSALQAYRQLFGSDGSCVSTEAWDASMLLPRLQALLEGDSGVFRAVLPDWQPSSRLAAAASESTGSPATGAEQLEGEAQPESDEYESDQLQSEGTESGGGDNGGGLSDGVAGQVVHEQGEL